MPQLRLSPAELLGAVAVGEADIQGRGCYWNSIPLKTRENAAPVGTLLTKLPHLVLKGTECVVEIRSGTLQYPVMVRDLAFLLANQPGKPPFGNIRHPAYEEANADIALQGKYLTGGGFDVNLAVDGLTQDGLTPFINLPKGVKGQCVVRCTHGGAEQQVTGTFVDAEGVTYPACPCRLKIVTLPSTGWRSGTPEKAFW